MHLGSILQNIEGDVYEVLRVERHNGYNPNTFPYENDLAIITLKQNVIFTKTVHHICLPKQIKVFCGRGAQVAGKMNTCFSRLSILRTLQVLGPSIKYSNIFEFFKSFFQDGAWWAMVGIPLMC